MQHSRILAKVEKLSNLNFMRNILSIPIRESVSKRSLHTRAPQKVGRVSHMGCLSPWASQLWRGFVWDSRLCHVGRQGFFVVPTSLNEKTQIQLLEQTQPTHAAIGTGLCRRSTHDTSTTAPQPCSLPWIWSILRISLLRRSFDSRPREAIKYFVQRCWPLSVENEFVAWSLPAVCFPAGGGAPTVAETMLPIEN